MKPTKHILDTEKIRADFPILKRKVHGKPLAYLDNAATSQKPQQVIDAITEYYAEFNANIHRGIHRLSEEATEMYEDAGRKTASFINAGSSEEIIFTKNATESLNLLAYSLTANLEKNDEIVISQMEHHSNLVPWQQIAKQRGFILKYIKINNDGTLNEDSINSAITKKTKIVSVTHVSNSIGTINPVREIAKISHENGAYFVVDGAQSVPHFETDVKEIGCDFLAFSSHKMLGPTGVGVLYGRKNLLEEMPPFLYGGGMIMEVTYENSTFKKLPWKFEAGTPNIAGSIGLGAAIDYLKKIGMKNIEAHDKKISKYAFEEISKIKGVKIYGPGYEQSGAMVSFNIDKVHPHDAASILDAEGIAIRASHHCCMPLMKMLGITGTARASFYLYNTFEEVDNLVEGIGKVKKVFRIT